MKNTLKNYKQLTQQAERLKEHRRNWQSDREIDGKKDQATGREYNSKASVMEKSRNKHDLRI